MTLSKLITPLILAALVSAAQAQAPGQIPGTLPPAPAVIPPPPPVAPAQVPSVVTPLPQPSYGIPRGVTAPVYGGSGGTIRMRQPPPRKTKRPRVGGMLLIRAV